MSVCRKTWKKYWIPLAAFFFWGCSGSVLNETYQKDSLQAEHRPASDNRGLTWFAPELHTSRYRVLFYGYDTLYFRLAAKEKPETTNEDGFRLLFDAHYGGNLRHYNFARISGGSVRTLHPIQHGTERCQLFNSMVSSCLYVDKFELNLSRADLEQGRICGLSILLSSGQKNFERITLPSSYIRGFLKAIGSL